MTILIHYLLCILYGCAYLAAATFTMGIVAADGKKYPEYTTGAFIWGMVWPFTACLAILMYSFFFAISLLCDYGPPFWDNTFGALYRLGLRVGNIKL